MSKKLTLWMKIRRNKVNNAFMAATFNEVWTKINDFISKPLVSIVLRVLGALLILWIGLRIAKRIARKYENTENILIEIKNGPPYVYS